MRPSPARLVWPLTAAVLPFAAWASEGGDLRAVRLPVNPIIHSGLSGLEGQAGANINGPSLIRVPSWIRRPLGRYYLYFAHHNGDHIRLAYADRMEGPWKIRAGGVLSLKDSHFEDHIASPDVHVDPDRRRIVMYYHGYNRSGAGQFTRAALSPDGLVFIPQPRPLGASYFRVFRWKGDLFALARGGELCRARHPDEPWRDKWDCATYPFAHLGQPIPRHVAVRIIGDRLQVFLSRIADAPEHLMVSTIELSGDWKTWKASAPQSLLKPEKEYEGASLPIEPSRPGAVNTRVHQLRDPAIFEERGRTWLLYSVAGESGIAAAELK